MHSAANSQSELALEAQMIQGVVPHSPLAREALLGYRWTHDYYSGTSPCNMFGLKINFTLFGSIFLRECMIPDSLGFFFIRLEF